MIECVVYHKSVGAKIRILSLVLVLSTFIIFVLQTLSFSFATLSALILIAALLIGVIVDWTETITLFEDRIVVEKGRGILYHTYVQSWNNVIDIDTRRNWLTGALHFRLVKLTGPGDYRCVEFCSDIKNWKNLLQQCVNRCDRAVVNMRVKSLLKA